ncbi:MAG: cupin domain-containing protein [Coriobacteriaceae bacterium]|nr:cupin domain-containing protein [Coriobacteriaceae bacterium]MCI6843526.1 cupin domain-containing protein [Coriobacteriaceae bacterium]
MNETAGHVFSIAADNPPVVGCTVSRPVWEAGSNGLSYFSLGAGTDISAELYGYHRLELVVAGEEALMTGAVTATVNTGQAVVTPTDVPVGVRAEKDTVYVELSLEKGTTVNSVIKPGEAFTLKDLIPYQDGRIVNMDLAHNDSMKFVLMSFDAGIGLSEHAAPGDALVFALDGEAIITYEGVENTVRAGQTFKFDGGGRHAVRANKRFKMALLVTLA